MDGARSKLVEELFEGALRHDPPARAAWLADAAGGDAELVLEVESLLAHFDPESRFLSSPPALARDLSTPLPARIGPFRVIAELGRGGMGIVYVAEQEQPRREVALKVLPASAATARALRRFEREAQILGALHHPGIAHVHAAGTAETELGAQPWFAMELVRGPTLVDYADAKRLDARERARLLAQVCDAVEHAHGRGIVHRDLKPSNVLVDDSTGTPQPKVLDFGIALAVDERAPALSSITRTVDELVGTVSYMSPEQASADRSIDARSDVYALGVLCYRLLCGRLPLAVAGKPLHEAVRIVREDEPTPASRVVPALRGDVDTILGKALQKDPGQRYVSAAALAEDLRRFLSHEPIRARPPTRAYALAKFARRNPALVGGVAAVIVVSWIGLGATAWQAHAAGLARDRERQAASLASAEAQRATAEAERAAIESRRASAIATFQRQMLARVQPEHDGRDVRLADVLDAAAAALPGELAGEAAAEGGVRKTLAESYQALGMLDSALLQIERARELLVAGLGASHEESIDALAWLGNARADLGRIGPAIEDLEHARADASRHLGESSLETLVIEMNLAQLYVLDGRLDEGEALARANVERRRAALGDGDVRTADALAMLGDVVLRRGALDEAEALLRESLLRLGAARGERHPSTLTCLSMLASVQQAQGAIDEPEALYRRTLAIGRDLLGDEHFEVQAWKHNLASILSARGADEEAEALLRSAHASLARTLGPDHDDTRTTLDSLVRLLTSRGRGEEARAIVAAERERACSDERSPALDR